MSRFDHNRSLLLERLLAAEGFAAPDDAPRPSAAGGPRPLSFAQQRMWFLDRLHPGTSFYNIPVALRLSFPVDAGLLARAVNAVIDRHEALRTVFREVDGEAEQVVVAGGQVSIPVADLSGDPDPEGAATRAATVQARLPFDLTRGPLLRATLFRLAAADHVFAVTVHHAVADGWSMRLFFAEIAALYTAFGTGQPSPLADLPIQYGDYALWQRAQLTGDRLEEHGRFWRAVLDRAPVTELPADRPRPPVQTFTGATHMFTLPAELCDRIRSTHTGTGTTAFMALLAGFGELLRRYTGQPDLVLGTYTAGRSRVELEPLIGFFVNTLVLRLDYTGDPTYRQALHRVRETCLSAFDHQDLPFEKLVEILTPPRDLSRNPLCQIAFQHFGAPPQAADEAEPASAMVHVDRGSSVFDMVVTCWDEPDGAGIAGRVEFNTDLYDPATVDRLLDHYTRLLDRATARPDEPLATLDLLGDDDRRALARHSHGPATPEPDDLIDEFRRWAGRTPDAPAVVTDDGTWTYARLAAATNRLAHHLRDQGVGAGSTVAVHLHRGPHLITALLALLSTGATYLPLDPAYPPQRLHTLLTDARPGHLLTTTDLPTPTGTTATVHHLDQLHLDTHPDTPPDSHPDPAQPAYLIYTSGSTGQPKGVLVPRRALSNRLAWMQDAYPLGRDDRVLHKTSIGFDVSLWELLWPVTSGAALVLAAPGRQADAAYLTALIRRTGVTTAHFVPSLLRDFLDSVGGPPDLPSLRRVICSGEVLRPELADRFLAVSAASLHNLYGPTEAAIDVTAWTCARGDPAVPIGRPISNVSCQVLDEHRNPVPAGVPGELAIGGTALAIGYLGRPGLTAERFVTHPLGDPPDQRLYLTGDLVRWRDDGALEYLGRRDDQVKIRGVRVELAEIDDALNALPGVRAAVCDARPDASGALRIVAYVRGAGDAVPSVAALRRLLADRLPDAFLPTAVAGIDTVPLSRSGKLDRSALPDPEQPSAGGAPAPPRTPTERRMLAIWRDVLPRTDPERPLSVQGDFFEMGGHSLLAMQVVARVRAEFGVDVDLPRFFAAPTVEGLAVAVDDGVPVDGDDLVAGAHGDGRPDLGAGGDQLLARLETMSDEQVAETLRRLTGGQS